MFHIHSDQRTLPSDIIFVLAGVARGGAGLPEPRVGAEAVVGGRPALVRPLVGAPGGGAPRLGRRATETNRYC